MPDRIISESFKRSPKFDKLGWFEEACVYRLMTTADDDGVVDSRPSVLRHLLFPTRESITPKSIENAITKLVQVGILLPVEEQENGIPSLVFANDIFNRKIQNPNNNNHHDDDELVLLNNSLSFKEEPNGLREKRSTQYEDFTRNAELLASKDNPYGYYENQGNDVSTNNAGANQQQQTVEAYVTKAISFGSPGQYEELHGYMEILPDELIKYAVDIACGGGFHKQNWNYCRGILRRWVSEGYKTVADVDAAEAARQAKKKAKKTGTDYSEMNYDDDW